MQELKKTLHEMADRGQLSRFLKQRKETNQNKREAQLKKQEDSDRNTVVIVTIIGGIDVKEMRAGYRKAQIRQLNQVLAARELKPLVGPMVTFGLEDMRPLQAQHNDPLVVQRKITTAMVRRILVDTRSSVDIITFECFRKLQYSEKDLEAIGMPLVSFGGHTTYPVGMKKLSVRIGEKDNLRTVDVNFLVVDIPMAYNIILGHPTLSVVKAVIAPYLLLM